MNRSNRMRLFALATAADEEARLGAVTRVASLLTDDVLYKCALDVRCIITSLVRLRRDGDLRVRTASVELLGRIGGADLTIRERILRALRSSFAHDPAPELRAAATAAMAACGGSENLTKEKTNLPGASLGMLCIPWLVRAWHLTLEARDLETRGVPASFTRAALQPYVRPGRESDRLIWALQAHLLTVTAMSEEQVLRDQVMFRARGSEIRALFRDAALRTEKQRNLENAAMMALFSPFWLKPFEGWSEEQTVHEVAAHLLARYEVPGNLRYTWIWYAWDAAQAVRTGYGEYPLKRLLWFILLGQGASLRAAGQTFGWLIPKGFVHSFVEDGELRRAMVCSSGGTPEDAARLYAMDMSVDPTETPSDIVADIARRSWAQAKEPRHAQFWYERDRAEASVRRAHWFGAAGWLARHRAALDAPSSQRVLAWAQERFLLKLSSTGRKQEDMTAFWETLGLRKALTLGWPAEVVWPASGLGAAFRDELSGETWSFVELNSMGALRVEGALMHHCVGTYADRCREKNAVIVSVRRGDERVATVEVHPKTLEIKQVSAFANRDLNEAEQQAVKRWHEALPRAT